MPEFVERIEASPTTALKDLLVSRILSEGPITFHDWMQTALYAPSLGYYMRADRKRWGREGDYRTSPERSELFAATFANYFRKLYRELDRPQQFSIVECGAGDGTFAYGMLSHLREHSPDVFAVTHYLADEVSVDARNRISERLSEFVGRVGFVKLTDMVQLDAAIVFSNELLDAFPVHRLQLIEGELRELYVSLDGTGSFVWSTGELSTFQLPELVQASGQVLKESQIIEVSPGIGDWIKNLASKVRRGFVVTVDYGQEAIELYNFNERPEGTLRAYARHRFVENVLDSPGDHDITTSVDWTYLKRAGQANGFALTEFERLDQFFLKAGFTDELARRLDVLTSDAEKLRLSTAAREMILPGGMASSFQVMVQSRNC